MKYCLLCILMMAFLVAEAQKVSDYDIVWDKPSENAAGSMPIGNGEVGLNCWVDRESGDLLFYVSRTDSWSETMSLLKLGRIRVSFTPAVFRDYTSFVQRLSLHDGYILIEGRNKQAKLSLKLFVDADQPVVYLTGESDMPVKATASVEIWRDKLRVLSNKEIERALSGYPDSLMFMEYPDVVYDDKKNITVYHRNETSVYPIHLQLQKLQPENAGQYDPLINRTFGMVIGGQGFEKQTPVSLAMEKPRKKFTLKIATHTAQTPTASHWIQEADKIMQTSPGAAVAAERTKNWWNDFWSKSYLFVSTPDDTTGKKITQSYILQRWMTASAGRGNYPIKFNGSIFTVEPQYTDPNRRFSADFRLWGGGYWWQNTRLIYYPLLQTGNFDMLRALFDHYFSNLPLMKSTAKAFYNAPGAVCPETTTIFGTFQNTDYGWNRSGLKDGEVGNDYIKYCWNSGLELLALMIDHYRYTGDHSFAQQRLLPMAREILAFFNAFFPKNENGIMEITPTHSLETYWYNVKNDLPTVAGLHYVIDELLKLPVAVSTDEDRQVWSELKKALPAIPVVQKEGKTLFSPAQEFEDRKTNAENPELYAIFPFPLSNITTANKQTGIDSYNSRIQKTSRGWTQDGQQAARLGLVEEAKKNILAKIENSNRNFRFPAIWGPNYDWTPDQCHGGNLMITLQEMVMQSYGTTSYLLPAFPKGWNVSFLLYAPGNTKIKGHYSHGALTYEKLTGSGEVVEIKR
ncbi:MAG: DUF5703 domain-containing protein [Agriterribacter sp.]